MPLTQKRVVFKEKHNCANFACMDSSEMRLEYLAECAHSSQILDTTADISQFCHTFEHLVGLNL